ncbi:hypothetical protein [Streptomyces sp. NPDC006784]|uniref:hypothetical protein n=1 Tax=Streptomyces sp. NPDC006784 TaxID=3364764 RepID=UPI00369B5B9C
MRGDAAFGVFVVGLVLFFWGVLADFTVGPLVLGGLLMVGAVAATARARRSGDPEVTFRPARDERPWRKRRD